MLEKDQTKIFEDISKVLKEISLKQNIKLDRDKFDFLKFISKTRNSGLSKESLLKNLSFLESKNEFWFEEIKNDELAETFSFKTFKDQNMPWSGWFITGKGRKILREIISRTHNEV